MNQLLELRNVEPFYLVYRYLPRHFIIYAPIHRHHPYPSLDQNIYFSSNFFTLGLWIKFNWWSIAADSPLLSPLNEASSEAEDRRGTY